MRLWTFSDGATRFDSMRGPVRGGVALSIGNFDGVHLGHAGLIATLRKRAAVLGLQTAVLTFEPHPRELFAPASAPPRLSSLRAKLTGLRDTGVDHIYVARFDRELANLSAEDFVRRILVERIGVRHVMVGDDFHFGRGRGGDLHLLRRSGEQYGFGADAMDTLSWQSERISSSRVRESLRLGDFDAAEGLLGKPYIAFARLKRLVARPGQTTPSLELRLDQSSIAVGGCHEVDLLDPKGRQVPGLARITPRQIPEQDGRLVVRVRPLQKIEWEPGQRLLLAFKRRHDALVEREAPLRHETA